MSGSVWRNPRVWIGIGISAAAIAIAIYRVELGEAAEAFQAANYWWLLPGLIFALLSFFLRAVRWQALFHPLSLPLERLFWIMAIGYTVTTLLPLRLGDLVRAHLVGEAEQESKARSFTTVAVEHLMDVLTVLAILLVVSPLVPLPGWVRMTMLGATAIILVSASIIALTQSQRGRTLDAIERGARAFSERLASSVREKMDSAIEGFSALGSPRQAFKVIGWSGAQWLAGALMMWAVLRAFDLPASFIMALFMVAMSALALTIPSSPGFIGVYHAVIIEALAGIFDVGRGQAASFAVIAHLLLFLPPVILGGVVFLRDPEMWDQMLRWRRSQYGSGDESRSEARARG